MNTTVCDAAHTLMITAVKSQPKLGALDIDHPPRPDAYYGTPFGEIIHGQKNRVVRN